MTETLPPGAQDPPSPQDSALMAELRWVHGMIRRDLRTIRQMAADVAGGLPAGQVQAALESLAASGPLGQLKVNCLQYCRFVHSHHRAESMMLFPALRRANPALNPVVDKLEADHLSVSGLLDEVQAAARALGERETPAAREHLIGTLEHLSTDLLAHLDYEEENIAGTLGTWSRWPFW